MNARLKRIAVAALVVCVVTACAPSDDPEGFCRRFAYLDEAFKESKYGFAPATLRLAVNKDFLGDPGSPLSDFLDTLERILYEMDFEGRVDFLGSDRSVLKEFQEKWSEVDVYCQETFAE